MIAVLVLCAWISRRIGAGRRPIPPGLIRWLVGFSAGGTADMISRDIAQPSGEGAGSAGGHREPARREWATATQALVASKPDGQTLMMILSGHITNSYLYPNTGFDPLKDVTPVSLVASSPLAIVANPNFPRLRHQVAGGGRQG